MQTTRTCPYLNSRDRIVSTSWNRSWLTRWTNLRRSSSMLSFTPCSWLNVLLTPILGYLSTVARRTTEIPFCPVTHNRVWPTVFYDAGRDTVQSCLCRPRVSHAYACLKSILCSKTDRVKMPIRVRIPSEVSVTPSEFGRCRGFVSPGFAPGALFRGPFRAALGNFSWGGDERSNSGVSRGDALPPKKAGIIALGVNPGFWRAFHGKKLWRSGRNITARRRFYDPAGSLIMAIYPFGYLNQKGKKLDFGITIVILLV